RGSAAVVSIEPATGAVRTMVGGPGFDHWKYNLVTQNRRQVGSSFKTFVLAALMEQGYSPDDIINGTMPCRFAHENSEGGVYEPGNYADGGGSIGTITSQTLASSNCAYVRLGLIAGLDQVADMAYRLGIPRTRTTADGDEVPTICDSCPSTPLGVADITPLEMASAYATIANDGDYNRPYLIERIEDRHGEVIYTHTPEPAQLIAADLRRRHHADGDDLGLRHDRQRRRLHPPVPDRAHRGPARRSHLHPLPGARASDRPRGRPPGHPRSDPERAVGDGHRRPGAGPAGGGQDRHDQRLHRRVVRRLHAVAGHRRVGRRPGREVHDHPGWAPDHRRKLPGPHLGRVHAGLAAGPGAGRLPRAAVAAGRRAAHRARRHRPDPAAAPAGAAGGPAGRPTRTASGGRAPAARGRRRPERRRRRRPRGRWGWWGRRRAGVAHDDRATVERPARAARHRPTPTDR